MPSRYLIRQFTQNTIYHVYNRGVEKRKIFLDEQDYKVFLSYLREYLSPKPTLNELVKKEFSFKDRIFKGIPRQPNNYHGQIELLAYCLMPNHFHFLIKQNNHINSLKEFMHSLLLRYSMYFNKRYERVGSLFQGKYKAIIVMDETYVLHLSRYIHINPAEYTKNLLTAYSSYPEYVGVRNTDWVKPKLVLSYFNNQKFVPEFKKTSTYKKFVEDYLKDNSLVLENLTLE